MHVWKVYAHASIHRGSGLGAMSLARHSNMWTSFGPRTPHSPANHISLDEVNASQGPIEMETMFAGEASRVEKEKTPHRPGDQEEIFADEITKRLGEDWIQPLAVFGIREAAHIMLVTIEDLRSNLGMSMIQAKAVIDAATCLAFGDTHATDPAMTPVRQGGKKAN